MFDVDYLLWTNYKRYLKYHESIKKDQLLLIGKSLFYKDVVFKSRVYRILFDDIKKWRNAGCVAIQYVKCMGAKACVVGVDGFTLVYNGDQHCYSSGLSDLKDMGVKEKDMEYERHKDALIYKHLRRMSSEGARFKIITPTIYTDFYDGSVLYE